MPRAALTFNSGETLNFISFPTPIESAFRRTSMFIQKTQLSIPKLLKIILLVVVLIPTLYSFTRSPSILYRQPSTCGPAVSEIPNIVHFVHILPPELVSNGNIQFEFRHFLSIYSAHFYLNPERIYIHTNAESDQLSALERSPLIWTRIISNLPTVVFNYETAPNRTSAGLDVTLLPNHSDFVRTRVMKKWGGIYMDEDVYLLKDLASLRRTGFQNVVGRQSGGDICCALFLSTPENDMITAYHALQDRAFDGSWATHAIGLLTRLAVEFSGRDENVLVLEQDAFFPFGWGGSELAELYQVHDVDDVEEVIEWTDTGSLDLTTFIKSWRWQSQTWRRDFHIGYALHGWNSGLRDDRIFFGDFGGITLEYVLARSSNFARALYPVVKHALDNGIIGQVS